MGFDIATFIFYVQGGMAPSRLEHLLLLDDRPLSEFQ